jgi:hypothetical protein
MRAIPNPTLNLRPLGSPLLGSGFVIGGSDRNYFDRPLTTHCGHSFNFTSRHLSSTAAFSRGGSTMDQATEFMALAAHCRRQAKLETDPRTREKLAQKAAHYDDCACSSMMALEDL